MDELLYLQDLASIGHKNVQSEALFVDVIRCMRGLSVSDTLSAKKTSLL